jgi:3-hydroxyisobutyrate dehydrogenase-like beta-hydroxyacid dehydrogenase
MAVRLSTAGGLLRVWNRTHERAAAFAQAGHGQAAISPRECVIGADTVVTMVSDGRALEAVLAGPEGVLEGLEPGALVIDMSTIGRAAALEAARAVEERGGRFVDAPVSGSVGPAERGELVALVGGAPEDRARAEAALRTMCRRLLIAGGVGQGQALKVVLNGLGTFHVAAFASMLALGERAGLPREAIVEAFTTGAFASPSYVGKKEKVLTQDYTPEFSLALTLKDAALNLQLQDEVGLSVEAQRAIVRELVQAVDGGLAEEDLFALEKHFARK